MIMQEGVVTNCVSDFKTGTKIEGWGMQTLVSQTVG